MGFRASLTPDDDAAVHALAEPPSPTDLPNAMPLLNLNAALQRHVPDEAAESPVPSDLPAEIRTLK
jgi:hypothetical protein